MILLAESLSRMNDDPVPPFMIDLLAWAIPPFLFLWYAIWRDRQRPCLVIVLMAMGLSMLALGRIFFREPYPGASFWGMLEGDWYSLQSSDRFVILVQCAAGFTASSILCAILAWLGS